MRYLKISKELIRKVLEKETENLSDDFISDIIDNYIIFADDGECMFEVNIYEFAYKCKEWAYLQYGIIIQSYLYNGKWRVDILKGIEIDEFFKNIDSEPEAIFKACNWVLENSK